MCIFEEEHVRNNKGIKKIIKVVFQSDAFYEISAKKAML